MPSIDNTPSTKTSRQNRAAASHEKTHEHFHVQELVSRLNSLALQDTHSLPKIAIIGDSSSGKTSLFEALTGLQFPPERRPLTSFAIHAQFKRTTDEKAYAKAYIRPGPEDGHYATAVEHLESFQIFHDGVLTGDDFVDIVNAAATHMYISIADPDILEQEASEEDNMRQLSDNTLVIEIAGPDVHNLNIIDFPGLMQDSSLYSIAETEAVKRVMMTCLREPQTIILAVIDATSYINNQTTLPLAHSVDPDGHRTVGVLTKCDLVPRGDEKRVLRIVRNKEHHLQQGWFSVKNWSLQERCRSGHGKLDGPNLSLHETRDASESEFFSRSPWNTLSPHRTGLAALRGFLKDLVNSTLQENISTLLNQMQSLRSPGGLSAGHSRRSSISSNGDHHYFVSAAASMEKLDRTDHGDGDGESGQDSDPETGAIKRRPTMLINACTVCLTIMMTLTLLGLGCQQLAQEMATDGDWTRLFLLVTVPLQLFVSLFFCQSIITTIVQLIGPVSQLKKNSKFFSAHPVQRLNIKNGPLPHVTIQCPVYKEGLDAVIRPTVESLEAAISNYRSHGGTANMFFNDDGMQLLSPEALAERKAFYHRHNIGWVARPPHAPNAEGLQRFIRRGKFKKASNMNYALGISIKVEDKMLAVDRGSGAEQGLWTQSEEEEAYCRCLVDVLEEEKGRAWADGDIRVGDYILIVDSDTRIPEECIIDAVSELEESPQVAILQFSSGVMNVTTSYFEKGITFFTELIYTAIRFAVANGDVSPFVGHNAFLRWSALQEVSFTDADVPHDAEGYLKPGEADPNSTTPYEKFWSESHVSEDFDISLRLQTTGYHVRLGAYCGDDFKEGVSLTVYDELARWEKYAYGCSELLFHPVKYWLRRGIFTPLFRRFIFSNMPLGSKVTILAYIGTYYAIGYAWLGTLLNYFLIGWLNGHIDHYYMNSWRIWVALIVIFSGAGNLALAILRYRGEGSNLPKQLWICFRWVPLLFIFLGGISMHVGQAIISHMLSIDMSWGATAKEVSDTSFFIEMPMIARRFKFAFIFCLSMVALIVCGVYAFPFLWRIDEIIAIFPLGCVIFSHFMLPVLLNPALMKFTW